eukprot:7816904-Pyramimonas_sp.AAC.1
MVKYLSKFAPGSVQNLESAETLQDGRSFLESSAGPRSSAARALPEKAPMRACTRAGTRGGLPRDLPDTLPATGVSAGNVERRGEAPGGYHHRSASNFEACSSSRALREKSFKSYPFVLSGRVGQLGSGGKLSTR